MKLQVDLVKNIPTAVAKPFATKVIEDTLAVSGYAFLASKEVSVSVVFVSEEEIRRLNKTYRGKDKVTDVLSFPEYYGKRAMSEDVADSIFLGELILCYDYIVRAAIEDGVPFEQEMAYILSHGILHLLGFRHGERMFSLQDTVSEAYAR